MKQSRLSPGLFRRKEWLYAFCGENYTVERYHIQDDKWEMVDVKLPDQFYARYGIKTLPMWDLPEQYREENKVLIFGGE